MNLKTSIINRFYKEKIMMCAGRFLENLFIKLKKEENIKWYPVSANPYAHILLSLL